MKLSQARLGLLALVALVCRHSGCGYINSLRAKNELNKVAQNYKEKKFAEAETHAKRAMELDPSNENAPVFIARTIHAQYRKGVDTPENIAKANQAIEAYKEIAAKDPNNDEAFTAVTVLWAASKPDEQTAWVQQRADNGSVEPEQARRRPGLPRQQGLGVLQSGDRQQGQPAERRQGDGKVVIQYIKPKDAAEYDKAVRCMTGGLEKAEKAISFDNDNEKAWSQKYNLLLEAKKLAQMEENTARPSS